MLTKNWPRAKASEIWRIIAGYKILLAAVMAGAFLFHFNIPQFFSCQPWPDNAHSPTIASRFACWDSAWYLILSRDGYVAGSNACAFYPLWPAVIRMGTWITRLDPLSIAVILANAFSIISLWQFYVLVEKRWGHVIARDALILLLAFPGELFFSFPYTESLFLLLVLLFFRCLSESRYVLAGFLAFFMPLTKAIGVFLILPFGWFLHQEKKPLKFWFLLLIPLAGYSAYFGVMHAMTGNALEGFAAQRFYPYSPSIANIFSIRGIFNAFFDMGSFNGMKDSILDRCCFLLFLSVLPFIYRLDRTWFCYSLAAGLVPAGTSYFMSYRRYFMMCFPVFIVLAQLFARSGNRCLFWFYIVLLAALQAWVVIRFMNFDWAG